MGNYTVISMAYAWQLNKAFDDVILINLKLKLLSVHTAVIIIYHCWQPQFLVHLHYMKYEMAWLSRLA